MYGVFVFCLHLKINNMKNIFKNVLLIMISSSICSQINLVPNYSFEEQSSCINITEWTNPTSGTPDPFNSCDVSEVNGVPNNFMGSEFAKTGVGYMGIITFSYDPCSGELPWKEYLQVDLNETLIAGKVYCVSFFVSLSDSSEYVCNDIGALLTDQAISSNSSLPLNYTPQIANNPSLNSLINKNGWVEVAGSFISDGTEKFITIGNFKDDLQSDTYYVGGTFYAHCTYYYIDDVSVILCDSLNNNVKELTFSFTIYPNPVNNNVTVDFKDSEAEYVNLFDIYGNLIFTHKIIEETNSQKFTLDMEEFENGFYFVEIIFKNGTISKKNKILKKK
jgi:OOP family OmpA-OmpF porin